MPLNVLICSAVFDSRLSSYREYTYSAELRKLGHSVTLLCGNEGEVWKRKPNGLPVVRPDANDDGFIAKTGTTLIRKRVIFRVSDFMFFIPSVSAIQAADVVHVIEFRTGIPVLVAALAKFYGKPIVYDHEQRGDRRKYWYSRVDSIFRRLLIRMGSNFVDVMRHTVHQNLHHWQSCTARRDVKTFLAPIGCNGEDFRFNYPIRQQIRSELGIKDDDVVVILTGKLHDGKRIHEVLSAMHGTGVTAILVGDVPADYKRILEKNPGVRQIYCGRASSTELAGFFSAADIALYTTFTVSYWEAFSTGIAMVLPRTSFTEHALDHHKGVYLFGDQSMFLVSDEQYLPGVEISKPIKVALQEAIDFVRANRGLRESNVEFHAKNLTNDLVEQYSYAMSLHKKNNDAVML